MRAATAGTVAPSHLLLKFGKLTSKFELLCKKLKASGLKTTAGRRTDAGTGGAKASRCGWFAVMAWDGADDVCAVGTGETVDERRRGKGRWVQAGAGAAGCGYGR